MRITWSDVAEADLDDIYDYIARDVPYCAEQVHILAVVHGSRDLGGQAAKPWEGGVGMDICLPDCRANLPKTNGSRSSRRNVIARPDQAAASFSFLRRAANPRRPRPASSIA